jgi:hypothetical protein
MTAVRICAMPDCLRVVPRLKRMCRAHGRRKRVPSSQPDPPGGRPLRPFEIQTAGEVQKTRVGFKMFAKGTVAVAHIGCGRPGDKGTDFAEN